jgi:hypothetical protein
MAWPGTTSALNPSSRRAGSCFQHWRPPRVFHRQSPAPDRQIWSYFFRRYGQLEKTRPRAIAGSPSVLPQVSKADDNDCRLRWSGGLPLPKSECLPPTRLNLMRCVGSQANYAGPIKAAPRCLFVQQHCPILSTPAQSGNGMRIRELWNRVCSPGTPFLPGLSVPPYAGANF